MSGTGQPGQAILATLSRLLPRAHDAIDISLSFTSQRLSQASEGETPGVQLETLQSDLYRIHYLK